MASPKRTAIEIDRLMKAYEQSGIARKEFCSRIGMLVSTFDYYRNRWLHRKKTNTNRLVKVELAAAPIQASCTIIFGKTDRRMVIDNIADQDLMRLIRIVESA